MLENWHESRKTQEGLKEDEMLTWHMLGHLGSDEGS